MPRGLGWTSMVSAWVLSAALAQADDRRERAEVAASAEVTAAPAAPTLDDEAHARAARLGLGGASAIMVLFAGPPRPDWIAAAGGPSAPGNLAWPLEGGQPGRVFGSGWEGRHRALDLIADRGTPIRAADRGIVAYAAWGLRGYGAAVILIHPSGWVTVYGHACEVLVRAGQIVERGQTIARVGRTGNAGGNHLHFELRENGVGIDPARLLTDLPAGVTVRSGPSIPPGMILWKVRRNQTLRWIARRIGSTSARLRELNGLDADDVVRPGQRIIVPEPVVHRPRRVHRTRQRR